MNSDVLLEELSLNGLPALRTLHLDGWILRFAEGYSKRANSVNPLYPPAGSLALEKKLGICERLYRAQALPPTFKLTSAAHPPELDGVLARRGYRCEAPTSVQTLALDSQPFSRTDSLTCTPNPTAGWLEAVAAIGELPEERRRVLGRLLRQIVPPACFAGKEVDGTIVAAGYAVVKAGFVGLFQLGTAPSFRRQGYARAVTRRLLQWGRAEGAHTAYLQVTADNAAALALYHELGFLEQYRYWYRIWDA